ncbi:reverse transcriptase domain-containing protein [Tanacetum coccineum]
MADDQPMWGNNQAVAPTPGAAIVVVDLGDNFTVKGHHLSMIKDRQFDGRARFKDIKGEMKEMRDGCNSCEGPHPSTDCDDKPMGSPKDEEANYAYGDNPSNPPTPEKKFDESDFEKTMREFMVAQKLSNDFVKNQFFNLKIKVEHGQKNHKAAIQDLETKFGRLSDQCSSRPIGSLPSNTQTNPKPNPTNDKPYRPPPARNEHMNVVFTRSGKTYDPPVNLNAKTIVIHDDSKDEADRAEKEVESSSSKQAKSDPPPLKAYKPKIPYPQRPCKENMEERYAKFIDLIKEVRINVPLVDALAGMPNYGKLLKDLVSNKSKMEQISVTFLNEECSAIVQNKLPPKLGDPGSFLIPCTVAGSVEYLALADLGASINLMSYSLYASLSGNTLKPTKMSIHLANHTYQYPMGIAENMLVQVGKFVFPADFVILQMEDDDKIPLILGRPFLHNADAIIQVKNKELNLGVGEDRITFLIDKAMQHSHSNDDTCFLMDVIDEIMEEELDALLDDSKPFLGTSEKINESSLDKEFEEFMTVDVEEIPEQEEEVKNNFE